MTDILSTIKNRMDVLQYMMEHNVHLENSAQVLDQIASVTKFWRQLSDEDRDYIEGARYAIEHNTEWNV